MTLRTAVIGAGTVSDRHLSGIVRCPRTTLVAVCDTRRERAARAAENYNIAAYGTSRQLFDQEQLDWVHICTPVGTHLDLCQQAIAAGVPVLVEKPVTETLDEYETLIATVSEHAVPVAVVQQALYAPAMRAARKRIRDGRVGTIRGVDVVFSGLPSPAEPRRGAWTFELSGGEFEEGLPHPIYIGLYLAGYPQDEHSIQAVTTLSTGGDRDFDYNQVQVQYVSRRQTCCSLTLLTSTVPQRLVHIHGEREHLTVDLISQTVEVLDKEYHKSRQGRVRNNLDRARDRLLALPKNGALVARRDFHGTWDAVRQANPYYYCYEREAYALEHGNDVSTSLKRAGWTVRVLEAIREAA